MPCFHPLKAYRSREKTATGGYGITFNAKAALIESKGGHLEFPCQKCIGCRIDRSRAWAVRSVHEASMHESNCFITLTYEDEHLPQDYSVNLQVYQNFLKRLRKFVAKPIKFFGCGEYGDLEQRPHYHFLIFGYRPDDLKLHTEKNGVKTYTSEKIARLWPYGFNTVGELTYQTAAYCARYVIKKIGGIPADGHYTRIHPITWRPVRVLPEFATSSRRPGLGSTWLQKYMSDVFPSDFITVDGKRHPVPAFYTKRLREHEQEQLKRSRKLHAKKHKEDNTYARRNTREKVFQDRITTLKRNLK